MSLYIPYMDDRKTAILYWRDKEVKVFAVDVTAGPQELGCVPAPNNG